jgi:high frequency lysogenization protein
MGILHVKQTEADKTLALAGIFQAAHLVNQVAFDGQLDEKIYNTTLQSIFNLNPIDVQSVFSGSIGVRTGLAYVMRYGTKKPAFKEDILMRYLIYMTSHAQKTLKNPALFKHLQRRLEPIISQAAHLGINHDIVISELASLYRQVFLGRRLQIPVQGKANTLKKAECVNKIYALLLAGIRAAVLWYQVGGNRWQLFFLRRRLRDQANFLLNHTSNQYQS